MLMILFKFGFQTHGLDEFKTGFQLGLKLKILSQKQHENAKKTGYYSHLHRAHQAPRFSKVKTKCFDSNTQALAGFTLYLDALAWQNPLP